MGYTTDFTGEINLVPPLNEHEISFLTDFNETRRMIRRKGPLFVGGSGPYGQGHDEDVIDHNRANGETPYFRDPTAEESEYYEEGGQPGLWCQWVPNEEGTTISWDDGEKFYNAADWMKYLITKLLYGESAREYVAKHIDEDERLKHFTFDHLANGTIYAQGEDPDDRWALVVEDSVVKAANATVTYNDAKEI